jgi:RimJ/RimL family protein N-acetyltransferase/ribosomal protein S18 acetylase RimI-like enzyme
VSRLNDLVYDTNVGPTGSSLDRIRALFHGSIKLLEREGSPYQSGVEDNCHWFTNGIDSPFFNQVAIYNQDQEVFEKAIARFYDPNIVHSVFLGGAGLVHAETLKAKGYVNKSTLPLMAYVLEPDLAEHRLRSELEVKRVKTREDLLHSQTIMGDAYGMTFEEIDKYSSLSLGIADSFRYNLLIHGVPVSTTHLLRVGNFLAVWDLATLKEHQKKGYAEELMRWVFATHKALGHELIVLQPSAAGQPLYRRLGFQYLEYLQSWVMEDITRMRRFTHHHLQFDHYTLRPLVEADGDWAIPYFNDQEILKWNLLRSSYDEKMFLEDMERWRNFQRNGLGIRWVIEDARVPLGMIACHHTDWKLGKTEIGYMAFPPSRGKGLIPTITGKLTELLLSEYQMERVEIRTDVANEPSRRAAEKAGFRLEGTLRNNLFNQGIRGDDAIFSIIAGDLTR